MGDAVETDEHRQRQEHQQQCSQWESPQIIVLSAAEPKNQSNFLIPPEVKVICATLLP
jgi:hypothetical protein